MEKLLEEITKMDKNEQEGIIPFFNENNKDTDLRISHLFDGNDLDSLAKELKGEFEFSLFELFRHINVRNFTLKKIGYYTIYSMRALRAEIIFQSMVEENDKNFLKEMKALLQKYSASIDFTCDDCSDTHGIFGEAMELTRNGRVLTSTHGWGLVSDDIDEEI